MSRPPADGSVAIKIIAFNDFHGNLEPPRQAIETVASSGGTVMVPAGGAAYLASAIDRLRASHPHTVVVSAGDMIGASPLISAAFLDEPTIAAMNLMRIDFNALGNHEFDRGRAELERMQRGGCAKHTAREPCRIDTAFAGARFGFLAANTITENGATLFPPYAIRTFGTGPRRVRVGFIGLTLKGTPTLVSPAGVAGLAFRDEADTANALVPQLRAQGADAIVLLIHQGLETRVGYNDKSCAGIDGPLLPILARLDPAVDLVVSGHTHNAYVCDYRRVDPVRPFLVTSGGKYGTLLTNITLRIDPRTRRVVAKSANNVIVRSESYRGPDGAMVAGDAVAPTPPDPAVAALVARYAAATAQLTARVVGRMSAPALRAANPAGEQVLGNLIADAQLAATRAAGAGGARIAFMNAGGVRADLVPDGEGRVTFGQIFAAQPFGNGLMVKSFTGRQIRALLEQQFTVGKDPGSPNILLVSSGFRYAYDAARPAGSRIVGPTLDGEALADEARYRLTMNSFLSSGGDGFSLFNEGADATEGPQDIDALEAYLARGTVAPPTLGRIIERGPG